MENVPLSEHIRKEAFYKSFQAFNQAISADPALIKTEVVHKLQEYDHLYGVIRSAKEQENGIKFT